MTTLEIERELRDISKLKPDWNGNGSIVPNPTTIYNVQTILQNLYDHLDCITDIYPTERGTISVDIKKNNTELFLEVGKFFMGYFSEGEYVTLVEHVEVNTIEIEILKIYIEQM